jgi:hypothetical protein
MATASAMGYENYPRLEIVESPFMEEGKALLMDTTKLNYISNMRKPFDFEREFMCDWAMPEESEPKQTRHRDMANIADGTTWKYEGSDHLSFNNSVYAGIGIDPPAFQLRVNTYRSPEEIKEIIIKELSEFWLVHLILSIDQDDYTERRTEELTAENTTEKPTVYNNTGQIKVDNMQIGDWTYKNDYIYTGNDRILIGSGATTSTT